MSVVTPTPLHPTIAANATQIAGPVDPDVLRRNLNTYVATVEDRNQLDAANLELLQAALGNGALSGGLITIGSGFSVSVAALEALVSTRVKTDAATTVGGLTPSTTNYLWLRQDGTFGPNFTSTPPDTADGHGDYFLWGLAITDGSGVTSVVNDRRIFQSLTYLAKSVAGGSDVTLTIAEAKNRHLELTGLLTASINLILPLYAGAEYVIFNNTTGAFTLTVKGASGTGIAVGQGKTAILRSNGTNYLRVTADNP